MEKISQEKFIELIRNAKKLKINGTTRSNLKVYATYLTTRINIDGITEYLYFVGNEYFYDGKNMIKTEIDRYPIYITLN